MDNHKKVLELLNKKKYREAAAAASSLSKKIASAVGDIQGFNGAARERQITKCKKLLREKTNTIGVKIPKRSAKRLSKVAGSMSHRHDALLAIQEGTDV